MHIKAKDTKSEWCYNNYVPLRGIYRTFLILNPYIFSGISEMEKN